MHSYAEVDGVPPAASEELLTTLLRDRWRFDGVVVADYFGIAFLELLHGVAADPAHAAKLALTAGVDVELPTVRCYGDPLLNAVQQGTISEDLVDRAVRRVLLQKCELGLLDPDWDPQATATEDRVDLDPPVGRAIARTLAEESVVLMANDGILPLRAGTRVALIGPLADDRDAMMGCYSFPRHVGSQYPDLAMGVDVPTLAEAMRAEDRKLVIEHVRGCTVDGADTGGIQDAVDAARRAEVCVVVLGDRAGLFGRGTSGEGCDAADLSLPGVQGRLLEALLDSGTPVVLVVMSGRPYALGAYADRLAAGVQAFFPGEEGGPAVAGVLTGRVCPSGRLPVSVPRLAGGQPATYLTPALGHRSDVTHLDPTPLYPFGHGLSYTEFRWSDVQATAAAPKDGAPAALLDQERGPGVSGADSPGAESRGTDGSAVNAADGPTSVLECATDGSVTLRLTVSNTGDREGTEIVQIYLHDPVAQVTRPVVRLIGYARVALLPGQSRTVTFDVHADLTSFTGLSGDRIVEAGACELRLSTSSTVVQHVVPIRLVGRERVVGVDRCLLAEVSVG
jgi:beta-xylosidase